MENVNSDQKTATDTDRVFVKIDSLPLGISGEHAVNDMLGARLIPAGKVIDKATVKSLIETGVRDVYLHRDDVQRFVHFAKTGSLPDSQPEPPTKAAPASSSNVNGLESFQPLDPERAQRFGATLDKASRLIEAIGGTLDSLQQEGIDSLSRIPLTLASMLREDTDQAVGKQVEMADEKDLTARCMELAVIAMGTAQSMGHSATEIQEVGFAGLLHDLSLFQMPEHFRHGRTRLTEDEAWQYRRHGQATVDLINSVVSLPKCVERMIMQVHERRDGSGFPKGVRDNLIHPRARILQVVDAYLTLVRPGPGRTGIVPHDAMAFLLHKAAAGLFDGRVMRTFLFQMTLYPIGSMVELVDGRTGTVVRRRGDAYSKPLITCQEGAEVSYIDLAANETTIARPVSCDSLNQRRLDQSDIKNMSWADLAGC